jgi:hypothetical protein
MVPDHCSANTEDLITKENLVPLTEEQLPLTDPLAKGYSMKNKRWGRPLIPKFNKTRLKFSGKLLVDSVGEI